MNSVICFVIGLAVLSFANGHSSSQPATIDPDGSHSVEDPDYDLSTNSSDPSHDLSDRSDPCSSFHCQSKPQQMVDCHKQNYTSICDLRAKVCTKIRSHQFHVCPKVTDLPAFCQQVCGANHVCKRISGCHQKTCYWAVFCVKKFTPRIAAAPVGNDTAMDCPWQPFTDNKAVCLSSQKTTWFEARQFCEDAGGELLQVEDFGEWFQVDALLREVKVSRSWVSNYGHFPGIAYESPVDRSDSCKTIHYKPKLHISKLGKRDCQNQYRFICQKDQSIDE